MSQLPKPPPTPDSPAAPQTLSFQDLFIGCDHAGFQEKEQLKPRLQETFPGLRVTDCGTDSEASVDYPRIAQQVCEKVRVCCRGSTAAAGLLLCGSGIGMCITANRFSGIRAASAWDSTSARLSRAHNDANVLCLGARLLGPETAWDICSVWLATPFSGGRHQKRLDIIRTIEETTRQ